MASFNRVVLVGNLTRDVELRYTQGGTAVTEIGLAVNDRVKKNDEWIDEATFVDITLWGRLAEVAGQYLGKGAPILIEGRLKLEQWEKDGQKRSKLGVVAEKMQMLGGKQQDGGGQSKQQSKQPRRDEYSQPEPDYSTPQSTQVDDDDIPF